MKRRRSESRPHTGTGWSDDRSRRQYDQNPDRQQEALLDQARSCQGTDRRQAREGDDAAAYFDWLRSEEGGQASQVKDLGDGFYAAVKPLLFHWTMLIGEIGNKESYLDRYCYASQEMAEAALDTWDGVGEPEGWHRHPASGRRRESGDPATEYLNP